MTIRLIQVGLGPWGRDWAANVLPIAEDIEIAAVADTDPAAIDAAKAHGLLSSINTFSSLTDAIDNVDADAVLVTASISAHALLVRTALEAGLHVLVEKPFAESVEQARPLVELAESRGLTLTVAQNYRYDAAPMLASRLLHERVLGDLKGISVDFRRLYVYDERSAHPEIDHDILLQIAVHHFDLMRAMVRREAKSVYCQTWTPPGSPSSIPTAATAVVDFGADVLATYRANMRSTGDETPWSGVWRMECADGDIVWYESVWKLGDLHWDYAQRVPGRVEIRRRDQPTEIRALGTTVENRFVVFERFIEAVRGGAEVATSGRDNLGSLALMNAARRSAALGKPVAVLDPHAASADR